MIAALALAACGGGGGSGAVQFYSVGGTVSGLRGAGLVLLDGAGGSIAIPANGTFSFPTTLASGSSYVVTVGTQPAAPGQMCSVANPSGKVSAGNITNVSVTCSTLITAANADAVAKSGNRSLELLLQIASFLGERLTFLAANLSPQATEACSNGAPTPTGSVTYAFSDNDHSGTLTPGDVVTITAVGCYSRALSDLVTGTVVVTIGAPPQPANYAFGFTATATLSAFPTEASQITGTFTATYTDSDVARFVAIQVASPGVAITSPYFGAFPEDTVTIVSASASKNMDYVTPQYTDQFASDFTSKAQLGEFSLTTTSVFSGQPGVFPTSGTEIFHGGNSALKYAARNVSDNSQGMAALDADGSGTFTPVGTGTFFWGSEFSGFPWWEPHAGLVFAQSLPGYEISAGNVPGIGYMFAEPLANPVNYIISTNLPVNTPIKLFLSAPLDVTRSAFVFTPRYPGRLPPPNPAPINAKVSANGAIVTLTGQTQLEHGLSYDLSVVGNLYSTTTPGPGGMNSLRLTTSNNLVADGGPHPAVAAPGQTVSLQSTRSVSTNSTIVGYQWRQTGGTSVQLTNATSATASFVVPATALNGEALVFELSVTDASGETDSAFVTSFVLYDLTQPFKYFRQEQAAAYGVTPEMATLESPLNGTITASLYQFRFQFWLQNAAGGDLLQLTSPSGTNLAVGTYTATVNPIVFDQFIPNQCSAPAQQFTVYEVTADASGNVTKFAADFNLACPGGLAPYTGSVRVNSTVPLP